VRLGHVVRALRADAGFSQESFSARVKVHRTFMGSLERGRVNPSLETVERLAQGLRMTAGELLKIAETGSPWREHTVAGRVCLTGMVPPISRPHVLGVDDAPFVKRVDPTVPLVGVLMEGPDLVETVAVTSFPVDGDAATGFLAGWIGGLRCRPSIQAVVLGGVTIAGLGLVDLADLATRLGRPVLAVTRHDPARSELRQALVAAGLAARLPILERCPPARRLGDGLFVSAAGIAGEEAAILIGSTLGKSRLPEPLRVAHLIGRALVSGESRGRV
jgi:endonuclease V-like protein UPF0215 family/DNA-binding XRE family transcriptional regulator